MTQSFSTIYNLSRPARAALVCAAACAFLACSDSDDDSDTETTTESNQPGELSFFVTSTKHDGNLGGLEGADEICQDLADDANAGDKTWRAYLSAGNSGQPINARERIGTGPWYNAAGALLAANLTDLYALSGNADLFITEKGEKVNGQWNSSNGMAGAPANEHDVTTGTDPTGNLIMNDMVTTCNDWTSNTLTPGPQVGHTDGMGPGMDSSTINFSSWSGGHAAQGCSATDLAARGGAGRLYCFAAGE
jgi:hypothetical protein